MLKRREEGRTGEEEDWKKKKTRYRGECGKYYKMKR